MGDIRTSGERCDGSPNFLFKEMMEKDGEEDNDSSSSDSEELRPSAAIRGSLNPFGIARDIRLEKENSQ